ncbi:hypothetical protein MSAN_00329700 [Mycena sanguinolenta]|uniref:Uncharacterized protein n=1 Tax=Mycena sanguinolenta TaxID=230812 RepID=A0A8H7DKC9_9AGAR|nr:hypothetical protein MSAN_00329700 [Mycena sanguinolenta]
MAPNRWKPSPDEEQFLQYTEKDKDLGLKAHLQCATHLACLANYTEREGARAEQLLQIAGAYDAQAISDYPELTPDEPVYAPPMFTEPELYDDTFMSSPRANVSQLVEELGQTTRPEIVTPEESRELILQEYQRMLEETYLEAHQDEDTDAFVGDDMPITNLDEDNEDDCFGFSALNNTEYYPYPSKTVMLLDIMDNLPRCRFTSAQMSLVLHFAKQLGVADVPSLKALRKTQQKLQYSCSTKPQKSRSHLGNIFYINDIRDSIARDFANPLVIPHMHFYPEENDGPISETYQAERWMKYTPSQLTPMFLRGFKRFWIKELARLRNGTFIIPHTLILRNGVLTSDASVVVRTLDGRWQCTEEEITVSAEELELDFTDLTAAYGENLIWVDPSVVPDMPNAMRKLVDNDEDLYVVMVSPWADDVSGNKSKQYNKHMNMYTGNGCLPGRLLQQEFNIHYISTSPHASSAEQFAAFWDHVKSTEETPIKCYNAATKRRCRCILRTPGLPADNPQQSEEACHMGGNANFPCRKCKWGGATVEKESDTNYHQCHLTGVARSAQEIRENLNEQLRLSMLRDASSVENIQRNSGTKDKITQYWIGILISKVKAAKAENPRRKAEDIASELKDWLDAQPGDQMNPLLDIAGLDPSQDTPVKLLHTILLGVVKYIWHILNTSQWSDTDRYLFAIRLQSTDISGLTVPPIRAGYMIQYKNNLIGKHFKTLMQTLAFHVHGISTPEQFALVKAAGELGGTTLGSRD